MENKKIKRLYVVIVILIIGLIISTNSLFKERQKNKIIFQITHILSTMTENVSAHLDGCLKNYDFLYPSIMENIDSFRIYSEYKPAFCSDKFIDFYIRKVELGLNTEANKQLFTLMGSISNTNSKEFNLLKKFIEFSFITRMERRELEGFCLLNSIGVRILAEKDTIAKGEKYIAKIGYATSFYETIPIMIIDGDTVSTTRNIQVFEEIPQKSGQIEHECTITFNQQGHILELPFTIKYYVK